MSRSSRPARPSRTPGRSGRRRQHAEVDLPVRGLSVADEHELVRRCLLRDPTAWRTLYDRHFGKVARLVHALGIVDSEADDLCQEIFLIVYRHLGSLPGRGAAGDLDPPAVDPGGDPLRQAAAAEAGPHRHVEARPAARRCRATGRENEAARRQYMTQLLEPPVAGAAAGARAVRDRGAPGPGDRRAVRLCRQHGVDPHPPGTHPARGDGEGGAGHEAGRTLARRRVRSGIARASPGARRGAPGPTTTPSRGSGSGRACRRPGGIDRARSSVPREGRAGGGWLAPLLVGAGVATVAAVTVSLSSGRLRSPADPAPASAAGDSPASRPT